MGSHVASFYRENISAPADSALYHRVRRGVKKFRCHPQDFLILSFLASWLSLFSVRFVSPWQNLLPRALPPSSPSSPRQRDTEGLESTAWRLLPLLFFSVLGTLCGRFFFKDPLLLLLFSVFSVRSVVQFRFGRRWLTMETRRTLRWNGLTGIITCI